jgi:hypothetical protein
MRELSGLLDVKRADLDGKSRNAWTTQDCERDPHFADGRSSAKQRARGKLNFACLLAY